MNSEDYAKEHRLMLKKLCDTHRTIICAYKLDKNKRWSDEIAVQIRDDLWDKIDSDPLNTAKWDEVINIISAALSWHKKKTDLITENATLKTKVDELEKEILELKLSPNPGCLFLEAQKDWNKHCSSQN